MNHITLVDYIAELLKPYADLPEFTTCVLKALRKLGHPIAGGEKPAKRYQLDECDS